MCGVVILGLGGWEVDFLCFKSCSELNGLCWIVVEFYE